MGRPWHPPRCCVLCQAIFSAPAPPPAPFFIRSSTSRAFPPTVRMATLPTSAALQTNTTQAAAPSDREQPSTSQPSVSGGWQARRGAAGPAAATRHTHPNALPARPCAEHLVLRLVPQRKKNRKVRGPAACGAVRSSLFHAGGCLRALAARTEPRPALPCRGCGGQRTWWTTSLWARRALKVRGRPGERQRARAV